MDLPKLEIVTFWHGKADFLQICLNIPEKLCNFAAN